MPDFYRRPTYKIIVVYRLSSLLTTVSDYIMMSLQTNLQKDETVVGDINRNFAKSHLSHIFTEG